MQLIDVHQAAIQECNKSWSLVQQTNEFYSNRVVSNGTVYSADLHSCVIDGGFLTLFMAFEHYLECSFICYMMGQPGLNGNHFQKYVSPPSEDQAVKMLKGINRFADFTNRGTILTLANSFFDNGGTYTYLNSISADFEEMKTIRNAISHVSIESARAFQGLVRNKLGSIPPQITTSMFLNTTIPNGHSTFFMYYKDIVTNAIFYISNPI